MMSKNVSPNKKIQTVTLLPLLMALSACQGAVEVAVTTPTTPTTATGGAGGTTTVSLVLTAVSPASGPLVGGTTLTLTGTGLSSGLSIQVGGATCSGLSLISSTQATCQVPAGSVGAKAVQAALGGQTAQLTAAFTYVAAPAITSISPNQGVVAGGTALQIFGTGFQSGATVKFNGTSCAAITFVNATEIDCTTPAGSAGAGTVLIQNPDVQQISTAAAFTYSAAVFVGSISPTSGLPAGGTTLTVTGGGFIAGALIKINNVSCTTVLDSATQAHCTTPAATAGSYNVTMTTNSQTVAASQNFHYAVATAIASGFFGQQSCAVLSDGTVNCWGEGPSPVLPGTTNDVANTGHTPMAISAIGGASLLTGVSKISVGGQAACALLTNGQAVCWGDNTYGQLGAGDQAVHAYPVSVMNGGSALTGITKIVTNGTATCALLSTQKAYCWGQYQNGMGVGTMGGMAAGTAILVPQVVLTTDNATQMTTITDLALGSYTGCYIRTTQVLCSGDANGFTSSTSFPRIISGLPGNTVTSVAVGSVSACIAAQGNFNVICWAPTGQPAFSEGSAASPVIGATATSYNTITYGTNPAATQIFHNSDSVCSVFSDNSARCVGVSGYGSFGNNVAPNFTSVSTTFMNVLNTTGAANLANVSAVAGHCALNTTGGVFCWGVNTDSGVAGNSNFAWANTLLLPTQISWQ